VDEQAFKQRTKQFALRSIRLVEALPRTLASGTIGRQFLRCATVVGANYRAACRGKSVADVVIAKLGIVEEETDEALYWLELISDSGLMPTDRVADLKKEADELTAMVVASIKTLRKRKNTSPEGV